MFNDGQNFSDQPVKTNLRTCDRIHKIATYQWDHYTTGFFLDLTCLLDLPFKDCYKMKAIDFKPKTIQQINLTGNLENNAKYFSLANKQKERFSIFQKDLWYDLSIVNVFQNLFCFDIISI